MTPTQILAGIAGLLALFSLFPPTSSYPLLALAVILLAVCFFVH